MEYRRLGKTGLRISAIALGGHWKGLAPVLGRPFQGTGYDDADYANIRCPDFQKNRADLVSRALDLGVNYIDACSPPEILAYAGLVRGRRDRVYLGWSWHTREPRYPEWRSAAKLIEGLDEGLAEAGLEYADVWRISLPADGIADPGERRRIEEATVEALAAARQQGKVRFTGVSSHDPRWLGSFAARFPEQVQVVLFPYTAGSRRADTNSLFDALRANDTGVLTIKPFAGGALFDGRRDDRKAELAVRRIFENPAICGIAAGFASAAHLENAVRATGAERPLAPEERAELEAATGAMWAKVSWLREWETV